MLRSKAIVWITAGTLLCVAGVALACKMKEDKPVVSTGESSTSLKLEFPIAAIPATLPANEVRKSRNDAIQVASDEKPNANQPPLVAGVKENTFATAEPEPLPQAVPVPQPVPAPQPAAVPQQAPLPSPAPLPTPGEEMPVPAAPTSPPALPTPVPPSSPPAVPNPVPPVSVTQNKVEQPKEVVPTPTPKEVDPTPAPKEPQTNLLQPVPTAPTSTTPVPPTPAPTVPMPTTQAPVPVEKTTPQPKLQEPVPSMAVLPVAPTEKQPTPTTGAPTTVTPATEAPPETKKMTHTALVYQIRTKGETFPYIAKELLGTSERWREIEAMNPALQSKGELTIGTWVLVPPDSDVRKLPSAVVPVSVKEEAPSSSIEPVPSIRAVTPPQKTMKVVLPLTGTYGCKIEENRVVALPGAVLQQLTKGDTLLLTPGLDNCLWLATPSNAERLLKRVEQADIHDDDAVAFRKIYYARSEKVSVDGSGRIIVPNELVKFGGLSKDLVLVGVDDHFELWDAARWQRYSQDKRIIKKQSAKEKGRKGD